MVASTLTDAKTVWKSKCVVVSKTKVADEPRKLSPSSGQIAAVVSCRVVATKPEDLCKERLIALICSYCCSCVHAWGRARC